MRRAPRRLLVRWLTRPARTPRWLRATVAMMLISILLVNAATPTASDASGPRNPAENPPSTIPTATSTQGALKAQGGAPTTLANAPSKASEPPGAGNPTTGFPTSPQLVAQGMSLYENGCSACHGTLLQGQAGAGPSLIGVGAGPVDFYLSSGRMPLDNPRAEPERNNPAYTRAQMDALIAFITKVGGGPPAPAARAAAGDLAVGFHQFVANCAGCHQLVGRGGLVIGAYVPNLQQATPLQVAEAVRMGPYLMPHFDSKQINQYQLNSLAKYVLWTRHPSNAGGWGIYNIGPIPEGIAAWFMGLLALVLVARLIGERMSTE
jgi:ubiquinol-cytochrome c reductase cytochrome c subunit